MTDLHRIWRPDLHGRPRPVWVAVEPVRWGPRQDRRYAPCRPVGQEVLMKNLTPWKRAQAELLLAHVRHCGTLRVACAALGLPYSTARDLWRRWELDSEIHLVSGHHCRATKTVTTGAKRCVLEIPSISTG